MIIEAFAQIAYETYWAGKDPNVRVRPWRELPKRVKALWIAVAEAVLDAHARAVLA